MENKITTIEITENELNYLINDLITYCFQLKEKGLDKDNTYGYKSSKILIEK